MSDYKRESKDATLFHRTYRRVGMTES